MMTFRNVKVKTSAKVKCQCVTIHKRYKLIFVFQNSIGNSSSRRRLQRVWSMMEQFGTNHHFVFTFRLIQKHRIVAVCAEHMLCQSEISIQARISTPRPNHQLNIVEYSLVTLHEASIALLTWVRIHARMFDHMEFEFGCAGEAFIAKLARLRQFARVHPPMHGQMRYVLVRFVTMWALVWPRIRVPLNMQTQRSPMNELLPANVAREIEFFRVDDNVSIEQWFRMESFGTMRTFVLEIDAVRRLMRSVATERA